MKQAENAIDTRSQDLRRAVAQLHKTVNYIRINRLPRVLLLVPVAVDDATRLLPREYNPLQPTSVRQRCVKWLGKFFY